MNKPLVFEWDDAKAESNLAKHGISFESAAAVFLDPARVDSMLRSRVRAKLAARSSA